MARKFNIGRQGEQLLNEEWHNLFMSLKYLNYNRYKNIVEDDIDPERQTNIPDHALKLQKELGADILKVFYPKKGYDGEWRPIFKDYYHPANSEKPDGQDFVDYRICINPETGAIEYWDPSQRSWRVARAQEYNGEDNSFNGLNFQFISDLQKVNEVYPVPYVNYGKLFSRKNLNYIEEEALFEEVARDRLNLILADEKIRDSSDTNVTIRENFIIFEESIEKDSERINANVLKVTSEKNLTERGRYVNISEYSPEEGIYHNYTGVNGCAIVLNNKSLEDPTWVHINASRLIEVEKRLIEIPRDGFINISSIQTEFYGFKLDAVETNTGGRLGTLLLQDYDFTNAIGGIQLSEEICKKRKFDFVYAITYVFDDYPSKYGRVTVGMSSIGENYQVYIGNRIEAPIALFLDGLALEQTDEFGETIYTHDPYKGTISFLDKEDAEIINNMQMAVVAFPKRSEEFIMNKHGSGIIINETSVTVDVEIDITNGNTEGVVPGYIHPMLFCSGIGLQETEITEDFVVENVIYNSDRTKATVTITIKGLILPNEPVKGFLADIGNSFIDMGSVTADGKIYNSEIKEDIEYIAFVNGLLLTSNSKDLLVENGSITVTNTDDLWDVYEAYIILEVDNADDFKVGLVFDDTVSYRSVRIQGDKDNYVYNDCNDAIVYIENGIILDRSALEKPINAVEGYYKINQIIKVPDDNSDTGYKYYKYDYAEFEPIEIVDENKINLIEHMVGYYSTTGSIHLLGNDKGWEGCNMSYYAYSFANMIDEGLTHGRKYNLPIPINYDNQLYEYEGSSARDDAWKENCESLSTYINGLMIENKEVDKDSDGQIRHYTIEYPKLDIKTDEKYYGKYDLIQILSDMYAYYLHLKEIMSEDFSVPVNMETILNEYDIMKWKLLDGKVVGEIYPTERLAKEALELSVYINEDMQKESTSYVVERIERNEFLAAYRDYIYLDVGEGKDHNQIFKTVNDSIETDFSLVPATVNVYQNGVLLNPSEYCRFSNNKIMFNGNVCGLQQLPSKGHMISAIPEHVSKEVRDELENNLYDSKNIIRLIEDKAYYIPTSSRDTILIEKRDDTSIRSATYEILASTYKTQEFDQDYYDIPDSLVNSADYIKIYINGVRYEGEYELSRAQGKKGIKLLESNALVMDPLYEYLNMNYDKLEAYNRTYNEAYIRQKDEITFEWR